LTDLTALETAIKPAHSLRRRTVSEGFWLDITLRLLLNVIIADG
jgi:hypothetical protein